MTEYVSTRGQAPRASFEEALLRGLAPDGGLYVPAEWPKFSGEELSALDGAGFADVAAVVIGHFAGDAVSKDTLTSIAGKAYARFDDPAVAPVTRLGGDDYLLELYHGPTLAFKDIAMQFLGGLFERVLARKGGRVTIIGATSGDTGAAAIEAFRGLDMVDVFILHPKGRVSEVQRRIMTSVDASNIFNIAVDGTFDDCQRLVKLLFADRESAQRLSLGGVNSINWVRLAVQIVYYVSTWLSLGRPSQGLSFVAPTGNFGDVYAGYAAKRMGVPIERLGVAVNDNDILDRVLRNGLYAQRAVLKTTSPSMDIQIASNFERLIFEASGRNAALVREYFAKVQRKEDAETPASVLAAIRSDFCSASASSDEAALKIAAVHRQLDRLIDPHTAVGLAAADKLREEGALKGKIVTLSTAHPAKFPEAVEAASGQKPALPPRFADLFDRPEICMEAPSDLGAIRDLLMAHARIVNG